MLNKTRQINKPWGQEIVWAETKDYVGKLIYINKGHKLSRQYHKIKEETILVKSGTLRLEVGAKEYLNEYDLSEGECFHITPNIIHRFCALIGDVVLLEVSTPHLEDVVRLEDDYDRAK
jgi:quercetin dioxygenase-like cupin family protein